jgi:hypothetical protein
VLGDEIYFFSSNDKKRQPFQFKRLVLNSSCKRWTN